MKRSGKVFLIMAVILTVTLLGLLYNRQFRMTGMGSQKKHDPIYTEINQQYASSDVDALIDINNPDELYAKRDRLIALIFGGGDGRSQEATLEVARDIVDSNYSDIGSLGRIDQLTFTMPNGINSIIYYMHAVHSGSLIKRLVIYHEGHDGDFIHGKEMLRKFLDNGFDVLAIAMPLLGKNSKPVVMIPGVGEIYMKAHEWMRFLDAPVGYFMRPIRAAVDYALGQESYRDISAVGFSGGAWSVALYAAIDERITHTYQIAGTMPFFLRSAVPGFYEGNAGDFEQRYVPLIRTANYLEIYVLGSAGIGREHTQIINQFDSVAAHGVKYRLYDSVVRKRVEQLGKGGNFRVVLDTKNLTHSISEWTMDFVVNDLVH